MTRPFRLLSLLPGLLVSRSQVPTVGCRYMSRRNNQQWPETTGTSKYNLEDHDIEEVEDKLEALFHEERRKSKRLKFNILKKKMTPPGPPDRKLTWQAIEQIKYLKQEHPEEWTVERLAEGFSVSTNDIMRVLRSKFIPRPERKAKQDTKVMQRYGQTLLPVGHSAGTVHLPAAPSAAALPHGHSSSNLVPVSDRNLMVTAQSSPALLVQASCAMPDLGKNTSAALSVDGAEELQADNGSEQQEEDWDGLVLSEQELEELVDQEEPPPGPMLQVGNDFFDTQGNFLFRI